jgi:hypothetical protein
LDRSRNLRCGDFLYRGLCLGESDSEKHDILTSEKPEILTRLRKAATPAGAL